MEKLIDPSEYTPQTLEIIETLKHRMRNTLIEFTDDQIKIFDVDGILYILANPRLGEEPVFDKQENFLTMVPMYNLTIVHDGDWIRTELTDEGKHTVKIKQPRLRILRPDLCFRIKSGEIVEGSF